MSYCRHRDGFFNFIRNNIKETPTLGGYLNGCRLWAELTNTDLKRIVLSECLHDQHRVGHAITRGRLFFNYHCSDFMFTIAL